jgi:hypothetical protein
MELVHASTVESSRCGERETVLGDLAELGMSDNRAFKSVLGLVLRRQLGFWKEWKPWFVLVAIVVPIGPLLATQSDRLDLTFFPNLEMWLHYGISYRTGVSSTALFAEFCFQASAIVTWSWTSAFVLGALARKTIWVNGGLFFGCARSSPSTGTFIRSGHCGLPRGRGPRL